MACTKNALQTTYDVFEYDSKGLVHPSGKRVTIDSSLTTEPYARSEQIVLSFFKQMFGTIISSSGFQASLEGSPLGSTINIRWKTPHWKLVKV